MRLRTSSLLAFSALCLATAGHAVAGTFTVVNRSNHAVAVAVAWHDPGSSSVGGSPGGSALQTFSSPSWVIEGNRIIPPGQSAAVYSGDQDSIYLRMVKLGAEVVRPRGFLDVKPIMAHPSLGFRIRDQGHGRFEASLFDRGRPVRTVFGGLREMGEVGLRPMGDWYLRYTGETYVIH